MSLRPHSRSGRIHPDAGPEDVQPTLKPSRSLKRTGSAVTGAADSSSDVGSWSRTASIRRSYTRVLSRQERAAEDEQLKRLDAPEDEHAAWLAERVRVEGRQNGVDLLLFYCRMLLPVAYTTALFFGVFAGLSYAIPNLLCNKVAKENSAAAFGMLDCINNDQTREGGYTVRVGAKLFWLLFWMVQQGWVVVFMPLCAWAMCGPKAFTRREKWLVGIVMMLAMGTLCVLSPRFGYSINHISVMNVTIWASFIAMIISAHAIRRYTGSKQAGTRWFFFNLCTGQAMTFYSFLLPMAITARANDALNGMGLTIVRLVVHPAIWAAVLTWFRFIVRNLGYIPEMTAAIYMSYPVVYASMYGRFLLLSLDNVGSVVIMNLIFACFDLASKLGDRASDGLLLKLLFGERGRDVITASRDSDDRRMSETFTVLAYEMASIFAASSIFSFGGVALAPGARPDHVSIWTNALAQAATTLVFTFLGMVMEGKYHNFEWKKSYMHDGKSWRKMLVIYFLIAICTGGKLCTDLIALFCPVYYPSEDMVLLEQCDKPSLFQAIQFSTADRFKIAGSYFNITASDNVNFA
ncbi:hypothetical protein ABPG75_008895 [Micractinium tetrahymenae]